MRSVSKSGYYLPNLFAQQILNSLAKIIGPDDYPTVIRNAGLPRLLKNSLPSNMKREVDFAVISGIMISLEKVFGLRGGRALAAQTGGAFYEASISELIHRRLSLPFKRVAEENKLKTGLDEICKILHSTTDQKTILVKSQQAIIIRIEPSPWCWGRYDLDLPCCSFFSGFLQKAADSLTKASSYAVVETSCIGMGDTACQFEIHKSQKPDKIT